MQRALGFCLLLAVAVMSSSVEAVPTGTTLVTFDTPVAPLLSGGAAFACASERTVSIVSDATSPKVSVVDANDPVRWTARFEGDSLRVTTRNGFSGKMKVTSRDKETLRAIADEGVAESLALDYRSGRAVFTTARNLTGDGELLGRIHYMRCQAVPPK